MILAIGVAMILACLLWPLSIAGNLSLNSSDAAGNGLALAYTVIASICLWTLLWLALLLTTLQGALPNWSGIIGCLLLPISGRSALAITHLMSKRQPVRWMLATHLLVPLLTLLYLIAMLVPFTQGFLPIAPVSAALWAMVALLAIIPWPQTIALPGKLQREMDERLAAKQERQARFNRLSPDAPIRDWLQFIDPSGDFRDAVVHHIRAVPDRQAQIEAMLHADDDTGFEILWDLDLVASPRLFDGVRKFLRRQAAILKPADDTARYEKIWFKLDAWHNTLAFFARIQCPMKAELDLLAATLRLYPDADRAALFLHYLDEMRREIELPGPPRE